MLLCTTLYRLYQVIFSCRREPLPIQTILASPKLFISQYAIHSLAIIFITLFFTTANSQEYTPQASTVTTEVANLSEKTLLNQAKLLKRSDIRKSIKLATEALRLSKGNNNYHVSAQSHSLLGDLALETNNINQSLGHFLQASTIYRRINNKTNHIKSSVNYANALLIAKQFDQADKVINGLLPLAQKYGNELPIALTFMTKGDSYYQQKRYSDAIKQYTHSLNYLVDSNKSAPKKRAENYKKIAESYKRLKNREKTAVYYKKALNVYTALNNKKLIARTLNTLAEAERYLGNYVVALEYSTRSLEIHKQVDDPKGYAKALMGAGIIYRYIGRYEKSLEHSYQAYLYYKKIDNASGIAKASIQMGFIYTRLEQFDQARSFYQLVIDLPQNKVEPTSLASALREMAVIDLNSSHYESAKVMAKKAYKIYKNENDKTKQSLSARIIGNIYQAQKDDYQAVSYFRESLSLASDIGSKIYQIKAQIPLANILIGKNTNEAISLLKKSLVLSAEITAKDQTLFAYRALHQAEKTRGDFEESLRYAEQEISLTKIIQDEKDDNEIILAKANLHSHKMEIELASLREKAKLNQLELSHKTNEVEMAKQTRKIYELELTKNKYANIALASLLLICFLAVIFIYRRFVNSRKHNRELGYLAARDPLTNCYNRRVLLELLNRDFSELDLLGEYCIIMADIDQFKAVNDTYGHSAGDSVLSGVANILQAGVRQNDIAARFGGEEFCLVLPGADQDQAMRIAETMRQKVEASRFDDITVTCSFGVSSLHFNATTPIELIDQADLALYKSKTRGRNQVTLWDPTLQR